MHFPDISLAPPNAPRWREVSFRPRSAAALLDARRRAADSYRLSQRPFVSLFPPSFDITEQALPVCGLKPRDIAPPPTPEFAFGLEFFLESASDASASEYSDDSLDPSSLLLDEYPSFSAPEYEPPVVSTFLFDALGVPAFFRGRRRIPRTLPPRRRHPRPSLGACLTALSVFFLSHFSSIKFSLLS
jgi:hypothetical protein